MGVVVGARGVLTGAGAGFGAEVPVVGLGVLVGAVLGFGAGVVVLLTVVVVLPGVCEVPGVVPGGFEVEEPKTVFGGAVTGAGVVVLGATDGATVGVEGFTGVEVVALGGIGFPWTAASIRVERSWTLSRAEFSLSTP